nr:hypothetical protein Iba_chr13bCG1310 [Ipomoea batatas]
MYFIGPKLRNTPRCITLYTVANMVSPAVGKKLRNRNFTGTRTDFLAAAADESFGFPMLITLVTDRMYPQPSPALLHRSSVRTRPTTALVEM